MCVLTSHVVSIDASRLKPPRVTNLEASASLGSTGIEQPIWSPQEQLVFLAFHSGDEDAGVRC